jgi:hypothetical protein
VIKFLVDAIANFFGSIPFVDEKTSQKNVSSNLFLRVRLSDITIYIRGYIGSDKTTFRVTAECCDHGSICKIDIKSWNDPSLKNTIESRIDDDRFFVVSPHISNFDSLGSLLYWDTYESLKDLKRLLEIEFKLEEKWFGSQNLYREDRWDFYLFVDKITIYTAFIFAIYLTLLDVYRKVYEKTEKTMRSVFKGFFNYHPVYVDFKSKKNVVESLIECLNGKSNSYLIPLKISQYLLKYRYRFGFVDDVLRDAGISLYNTVKVRYASLCRDFTITEKTLEDLFASKSNYVSALIGGIIGALIGFILPKKI